MLSRTYVLTEKQKNYSEPIPQVPFQKANHLAKTGVEPGISYKSD